MNRYSELSKQICDFLKSHKLISVKGLEKKLSLPASTIAHALAGDRIIPLKYLYPIIFELVQYGLKIDGYVWEIDDNLDVPNIYGRKLVELVEVIEDGNRFVYIIKEYRTLAGNITDLL